MYKNYIFDLYGTLIDINTNEDKSSLWKNLASFYGFHGASYTPHELKKTYSIYCELEKEKLIGKISTITNKNIEEEEINLIHVFESLYTNKKVHPTLELCTHTAMIFRILSTKYIKLYDGVVDLLTSLKKEGGNIYLLSNAQRCFTEYELNILHLTEQFDDIFLSSDYEHKKPDPNFYKALMDKYSMKKEETIMIGNDLTSDIQGAHLVSIDSLYMHTNLSPEYATPDYSTYRVMDGSIKGVKDILLNQ